MAGPALGTVTVNADGTFTYDPSHAFPTGQTQVVSFTYQATDRAGATSAPAAVAITVNGGPALAENAPTKVGHGQTVVVATVTPGLAGDTETLAITTAGRGTLALANGVVSYTAPATGGADTIAYTITDQYGDKASGTVTTTVDAGPTAATGTLTVGHNTTSTITGLLNGLVAAGLAGDTETLTSVSATSGTASLVNGVATFIAPASGTSAITYKVTDQLGDTATAVVNVTVDPGPATGAVSQTVKLGQSAALTSAILAAAKFGLPGDTLTITADSTTNTLGLVSLVNGVLTYTASGTALSVIPANGTASDTFSYTIADQYGDTATGLVAITVTNPATVITGPATGGGTIQGTTGADIINAQGYGNTINSNGGNDTINAGLGNTTVNTGTGNDIVNLAGYNNIVSGGDGANTITGSAGNLSVNLGNGNNTVTAGGYNNTITLGNGIDVVNGGAGNATITLGSGKDTVTIGGYNNSVVAGNGNDVVTGGLGNGMIRLGNGNDAVNTSGYSNQITVGSGVNTITVLNGGLSTIIAGAGTDVISLSGYNNIVTLNGSNARVSGGLGNDLVTVNGGNDQLTFAGWNDHAILNGIGIYNITDNGGALRMDIGSSTQTDTFSNLGADASWMIDLLNGAGNYGSVAAVMTALRSDGHGGTLIALGATGSIDLVGVATNQIHASNFRIG